MYSYILLACLAFFNSSSVALVLRHHRLIGKASNSNPEVVVILHGLLGSSRNFRTWSNLLHPMVGTNMDIISMDLRNHGRNMEKCDDMSYPAMAEDVVQTLQEAGIRAAHFIGHSMGGKVASALSLIKTDIDIDVKSLTMLDISPVNYQLSEFTHVSDTMKLLKEISSLSSSLPRRDIELYITQKIPSKSMQQFIMSNIQWTGDVLNWSFHLPAICNNINNIAGYPYDHDNMDHSLQYTGPTMILRSENNDFVKPEHARKTMRLFPNCQVQTVKNSGHWLHIDQPETTANIVSNFIRQATSMNRDMDLAAMSAQGGASPDATATVARAPQHREMATPSIY